MKAFTIKFTTNKNEYDLLVDDTNIENKLLEYGIDLSTQNNVIAKITIMVDTPTQIKFDLNSIYEDFIEDVAYDSQDFHPFHSIILKDTGINVSADGVISVSNGGSGGDTPQSDANTIYVSTTGGTIDGSYDGTIIKPYNNIANAIDDINETRAIIKILGEVTNIPEDVIVDWVVTGY